MPAVMTRTVMRGVMALLMVGLVSEEAPAESRKWLIAHRGASAYAPEHTLAAYRLALDQGADYVEPDLGVTKDGVLVCLHDETLERTTDVETRFPDRARASDSGAPRRWFVSDFTLAEVKTLDAGSWFAAKFAGERVPTLDEVIDLVGDRAGLFPELKAPAAARAQGLSMEPLVVELLRKRGLAEPAPGAVRPRVIIQSFDADSLRRLSGLLPAIPRVLLVEPDDAPRWTSEAALREVKSFATGLGPHKHILEEQPTLVARAHAVGLTVIPWTFRSDRSGRFEDVSAEMRHYLYALGVDGLFTNNPDLFPRAPAR
jgi:glycerophosphoryl diester phosphodiesterase